MTRGQTTGKLCVSSVDRPTTGWRRSEPRRRARIRSRFSEEYNRLAQLYLQDCHGRIKCLNYHLLFSSKPLTLTDLNLTQFRWQDRDLAVRDIRHPPRTTEPTLSVAQLPNRICFNQLRLPPLKMQPHPMGTSPISHSPTLPIQFIDHWTRLYRLWRTGPMNYRIPRMS